MGGGDGGVGGGGAIASPEGLSCAIRYHSVLLAGTLLTFSEPPRHVSMCFMDSGKWCKTVTSRASMSGADTGDLFFGSCGSLARA